MITGTCFADTLRSTCNRLPHQTAIIDETGEAFTYLELNRRVNALSNYLLRAGLTRGEKLAILLPNCIEIVEVIFATAKIGVISIPLNYSLNSMEIELLLEHSDARMLIAHSDFSEIVNRIDNDLLESFQIIWVGNKISSGRSYEKIISNSPIIETIQFITSQELCNIVYTSGTTGNPKGVMRTHNNNIWAAINISLSTSYRKEDKELMVMPLWSVAFFNLLVPNILAGSTIIIQKEFDPERIMETIEREEVSRVYLVPSMLRVIMALDNFDSYNTKSLKQICTGSAPISIETKLQIFEVFPQIKLRELWGMTEGGLITFESEDALYKPGSVGLATPFNEVKIVDIDGFETPFGKVGEIVISGPSVFSGYYKNQDETERVFDTENWFHTQDLAHRDEENYCYISGRTSEMIIFDNNKVYPQEIENVIQMHPKIKECIVLGKPDSRWGEVVVAAVELKKGEKIEAEDLKNFVRRYIANYKVPKYIYFFNFLPKTQTGKLKKYKILNDCV